MKPITTTDIHWMLKHTTTSLPYVLIMLYLMSAHWQNYRRTGRGSLVLWLGLSVTVLISGTFLFNQPPFRFMVSPAINALVKDLSLVLQGCLLAMYTDALAENLQRFRLRWGLFAASATVPVILVSRLYAAGTLVINDNSDIMTPWLLNAYALGMWAYSLWTLTRLLGHVSSVPVRWRVGNMIAGYAAGILYIGGRWLMAAAPHNIDDILIVSNRLCLTLCTLLIALGLSMPRWYARLGLHLNVLRSAWRHMDNLIGFLGMINDGTLGQVAPSRMMLRSLSLRIADEMGLDTIERTTLRFLCRLVPIEFDFTRTYIPVDAPEQNVRMNVAETVISFSAAYEELTSLYRQGGDSIVSSGSTPLHVVIAARLYLEGADLDRATRTCTPSIRMVVHPLFARLQLIEHHMGAPG